MEVNDPTEAYVDPYGTSWEETTAVDYSLQAENEPYVLYHGNENTTCRNSKMRIAYAFEPDEIRNGGYNQLVRLDYYARNFNQDNRRSTHLQLETSPYPPPEAPFLAVGFGGSDDPRPALDDGASMWDTTFTNHGPSWNMDAEIEYAQHSHVGEEGLVQELDVSMDHEDFWQMDVSNGGNALVHDRLGAPFDLDTPFHPVPFPVSHTPVVFRAPDALVGFGPMPGALSMGTTSSQIDPDYNMATASPPASGARYASTHDIDKSRPPQAPSSHKGTANSDPPLALDPDNTTPSRYPPHSSASNRSVANWPLSPAATHVLNGPRSSGDVLIPDSQKALSPVDQLLSPDPSSQIFFASSAPMARKWKSRSKKKLTLHLSDPAESERLIDYTQQEQPETEHGVGLVSQNDAELEGEKQSQRSTRRPTKPAKYTNFFGHMDIPVEEAEPTASEMEEKQAQGSTKPKKSKKAHSHVQPPEHPMESYHLIGARARAPSAEDELQDVEEPILSSAMLKKIKARTNSMLNPCELDDLTLEERHKANGNASVFNATHATSSSRFDEALDNAVNGEEALEEDSSMGYQHDNHSDYDATSSRAPEHEAVSAVDDSYEEEELPKKRKRRAKKSDISLETANSGRKRRKRTESSQAKDQQDGDDAPLKKEDKRRFRRGDPSGPCEAEKMLKNVHVLGNPPDLRNAGTFTRDEEELLRQCIAAYQYHHDLNINDLVKLIQYTIPPNTVEDRSDPELERHRAQISRQFWREVYSMLPKRKTTAVQRFVRRRYHAFEKGGGSWDPEEDELLRKLYEQYPNRWKTIASMLGNRSEGDVRDHYRNYVQYGADRNTQRWSKEEEESLKEAMADACEKIKSDMIAAGQPYEHENLEALVSWLDISRRMKGKRSRLQCQTKWSTLRKREEGGTQRRRSQAPRASTGRNVDEEASQAARRLKSKPGPEHMRWGDKLVLVEAIVDLGYNAEEDIVWPDVVEHMKDSYWTANACKAVFKELVEMVGDRGSVPDTLDAVVEYVGELPETEVAARYNPNEDIEDDDAGAAEPASLTTSRKRKAPVSSAYVQQGDDEL